MKNFDFNGLISSVSSGALCGVCIGGYYGKTLTWTIAAALFGVIGYAFDFLRDQKRKRIDQEVKKAD